MSGNTTDGTTIRISRDTKALLEEQQKPGETFNETVRRLCGQSKGEYVTQAEVREIAREEAREEVAERVVAEAQR